MGEKTHRIGTITVTEVEDTGAVVKLGLESKPADDVPTDETARRLNDLLVQNQQRNRRGQEGEMN